jgi:tetratricopeptide (TPR) repeat protein
MTGVAFGRDGKLLTAGPDGVVRLWPIVPARPEAEAARREAARQEVLAWHERQARADVSSGNWFAAAFHLGRLLDAEPDNKGLHARLVFALAGAGRWPQAVAQTRKALERGADPEVLLQAWQAQAASRLAADDLASYRRLSAALVECFGTTINVRVANDVASHCTLLPDALADFKPLLPLIERAAAAAPGNYTVASTHASVLYRAGRLADCLGRYEEAIRLHGKGGTPFEWLFLAMAHHRLGHAGEAKAWLDKSARWLDQPGVKDPQDQAALRLLRREAEALLAEKRSP